MTLKKEEFGTLSGTEGSLMRKTKPLMKSLRVDLKGLNEQRRIRKTKRNKKGLESENQGPNATTTDNAYVAQVWVELE